MSIFILSINAIENALGRDGVSRENIMMALKFFPIETKAGAFDWIYNRSVLANQEGLKNTQSALRLIPSEENVFAPSGELESIGDMLIRLSSISEIDLVVLKRQYQKVSPGVDFDGQDVYAGRGRLIAVLRVLHELNHETM